jgi:chromosome segregation ATPase
LIARQIDNSKDEIAIKDHELVKEHFDHHKVEKEKEAIRSEALKLKRQIKNCEEIMEAQEAEKIKLNSVVGKADTERVRQQKEFAAVIGERDSLRSQVIQRDAELSTLYEKLKIQRSMLDKGTATYESRKEVEREERRQIAKLKMELQKVKLQVLNSEPGTVGGQTVMSSCCVLVQIAGSEGLKQEVLRLEKDIRAQQYKSTVLEMVWVAMSFDHGVVL